MASKVIAVRIDEAKLSALQNLAGEKGYKKLSEFLKALIDSVLENGAEIEKPAKLIYPADKRCRRLYEAFLEATNGEGGRVDKSLSRQIQLKAAISQYRTFKKRVEMLKAQGFLAEKPDCYVVQKRWEGGP